MIDQHKRAQLLERGFVLFPQLLPASMVQHLRDVTGKMLEGRDHSATRSQGSMMLTSQDPAFADLIAYAPALQALASLGYAKPTFSDGYVISKPGASPRLFWHYDWFAWEDPSSYQPEPQQLFAMYYLSDTTPANGCLRVIPGSHIQHNALHDLLGEPHSRALSEASNLSLPEFSDREDEESVPVRAGDLLIGDARLLHAAHENTVEARRTLITLWYQPNFEALPPRVQAQMAAKTQKLPASWPEDAKEKLSPLLPTARFHGGAEPYGRSLYRKAGTAAE